MLTAQPPAPAREPVLPAWLKFGGELRGRGEFFTGLGFAPGNDDGYYLHRLRLNATVTARAWLKLFVQVQDSQAPAYRRPAPSTAVNTLDLRQAHLELGSAKGAWSFRAGRQELVFGEERLVGSGNWGNVARSFEAARLSWRGAGGRVDAFASTLVVPQVGRFDRPRSATQLHGIYGSFDRWIPQTTVEPFFFWKAVSQPAQDIYTTGVRWVGKLPARVEYNIEMAFQAGRSAGEEVRAWAGHWMASCGVWKQQSRPRLVAEYNYASGDGNPGDGRRGTFDQLFPTNHAKYGIADQVGWRNIHDAMAGLDWRPGRRWRFNFDYHSFWLASARDALYSDGGAAIVRNLNAISRHVGQELDLQATCRFSGGLQLVGGVARLWPGGFLKQSTRASRLNSGYLMWVFGF